MCCSWLAHMDVDINEARQLHHLSRGHAVCVRFHRRCAANWSQCLLSDHSIRYMHWHMLSTWHLTQQIPLQYETLELRSSVLLRCVLTQSSAILSWKPEITQWDTVFVSEVSNEEPTSSFIWSSHWPYCSYTVWLSSTSISYSKCFSTGLQAKYASMTLDSNKQHTSAERHEDAEKF
jgi:hypothetical protein